jgi:hypothetical protein
MSSNSKRLLGALAFFIWMAFVVAAFYVTQKPAFIGVINGIVDTLWTLVVWVLLLVNAAGIGRALIQKLPRMDVRPPERLLLGTGIGLGLLGLAGFILGVIGWTHPVLLVGFQVTLALLLWWRKILQSVWEDGRQLVAEWRVGMATAPLWLKIALGCTLSFAFLLTLTPPAEAFDALFYHLVGPERFLHGLGMQPSSVPHFWFPALPEGVFLWAQGLMSVRTTQLLHFAWAVLGALLLWYWAKDVWDAKTGLATCVILLSMPSLYLLASWAYTDFALTFYGLAALYGVYKACSNQDEVPTTGWIVMAGIAAGMAMGVKYTSFLVPVTGVLLLLWWQRRNLGFAVRSGFIFSLAAVAIAFPWYLRSWIVMGNPFFPFAFGGLYWDAFRTDWYAEHGSGIGWDLKEIFLLPLNATLGHRDANYYDGRIGPLYLTLAPLTIYVLLTSKRLIRRQRRILFAIALFALLSVLTWVSGVVNSAALWQTRLLFPALIPFALPTALGLVAVKKLDTSHLRVSFIFNFVVIAVVAITLIDAGLNVLLRNPLAYAAGIETQEAYLEKVQPSYAHMLQLLEQAPDDAKIYSLFEPRSYYTPRDMNPDSILDNFSHDLYLYGNIDAVLQAWLSEGYTHVLVYRRGVDFISENRPNLFTPEQHSALDHLIQNRLTSIGTTEDSAYELYKIKH